MPNGLVMRSRPYRNDRIITAIRALYFAGGTKSFAKQFHYLFPTYETHEGEVREVPIHMVALVATAVCRYFYLAMYCSHLFTSSMQHFVSGPPENNKSQSFQPTPTWMYTTAMSIH
jgi:hypothetical protein